MEKPNARTGWLWVKEGFALFRRQPLELSSLFLAYMLLMLTLSMLPWIGKILPLVLVPVFSQAFMQACVHVEQGRRVTPILLFTIFRSPALPRLLALGVLYLAAAVLALAASSLMDGGVFWKVITGQMEVDPQVIQQSHMMRAMLFAAVVYAPAAMAFWYAAPLADWQGMGTGKAVFYSFFAVHRAGRAFLMYGLAWAVIGIIIPAFIGTFLAILTGQLSTARLVLFPVSLLMAVVMYCSFYPTYTSIFGRPEPLPEPVDNG